MSILAITILFGFFVVVIESQYHHHHHHDHRYNNLHNHHHQQHHHQQHHHRHLLDGEEQQQQQNHECGAPEPTIDQLKETEIILQDYVENRRKLQDNDDDIIIIPVCFHIIQDDDETYSTILKDDDGIQLQLDALNNGFSSLSCCDTTLYWCDEGDCSISTGFRFEMAIFDANENENDNNENNTTSTTLANQTSPNVSDDDNTCITRTVNTLWYNAYADSYNENEMKRTLRRGGANVLNIYFNDISTYNAHATFPIWYKDNPLLDGVVINDYYIAGGDSYDRNEGDILCHEAGHWLGLYHTFAGYGCLDGGDGIFDTPPQQYSTYSDDCPIGDDSCPDVDGVDPIHNFMDYSSDQCRYQFTLGQVMLMQAQYEIYRAPSATQERDVIVLIPGNASEPIALTIEESQTYTMEIGPDDRVACSVIGNGDDNDFYVRLGAAPDLENFEYDCSDTYGDELYCFLSNENDDTSVWVTVIADNNIEALSVGCTILGPLPPVIPLQSSIPSEPFTVAADEVQVFNMTVKGAHSITCKTTGGRGYLDLYWRYNEVPDLESYSYEYDCADTYGFSTNATCTQRYQQGANSIWAAVKGDGGAFNVTITCTNIATIEDGVGITPLAINSPTDIGYLSSLHSRVFSYETNSLETVTCTTTATNGDVDLLMNYGSEGDIISSDCTSTEPGPDEFCSDSAESVTSSELFITVLPLTDAEDVTLNCTSVIDVDILYDGQSEYIYSLSTDEIEVMKMDINPTLISNVICVLRSDDDDADLYVGLGFVPDIDEEIYNCSSSTGLSSHEDCVLDNIGGVTELYALIHAKSYVYDLYLTCLTVRGEVNPASAEEFSIGTSTDPFALSAGESRLFEFDIDSDNGASCSIEGPNGDADLYVRWDEAPETSVYACAGQSPVSVETCTVSNLGGSTKLFVQVKAYKAFTDLILTCDLNTVAASQSNANPDVTNKGLINKEDETMAAASESDSKEATTNINSSTSSAASSLLIGTLSISIMTIFVLSFTSFAILA